MFGSEDTALANEIHYIIPNLLKGILSLTWNQRQDWFFGVNMAIYYSPENDILPIIPHAFLSLGVIRHKGEVGRKHYILWEENYIVPIFVLEIVSENYAGEYEEKQAKYSQLGILYYVIYNPEYWRRDKHNPFEVYRLVNGVYLRQDGEPVWMPEIGLAIGRGHGIYDGSWAREWLYWYDDEGNRYPSPEELAVVERERANLTSQALGKAIAMMLSFGLNIETIAESLELSIQEINDELEIYERIKNQIE